MSDPPSPAADPAINATPRLDNRDIALRFFAALGLAFSAMLLVDYIHAPVFCGDRASGCDAVKHSRFSHIAGVPLPLYGTLFFSAMIVAAVSATRTGRKALAVLGTIGVVSGVAFLAIQGFVIHQFCRLCLVVDSSAISAGALALVLGRDTELRPPTRGRLPTLGLAMLALCVPLAYGLTRPQPVQAPDQPIIEPVPEVIAREQSPGVATVVEFVDFECPFCRRQQEALAPVLASYGTRVHLVRRNVPLSFHQHARGAARAACCAEEQGRGDRMAEALFTADDITPEGCAHIAERVGVDMATWRACLASQRPDVRLERDHNDARDARVGGLPTLWIGREKFEGLTSPEALRASIDRALGGSNRPADAARNARSGT